MEGRDAYIGDKELLQVTKRLIYVSLIALEGQAQQLNLTIQTMIGWNRDETRPEFHTPVDRLAIFKDALLQAEYAIQECQKQLGIPQLGQPENRWPCLAEGE